MNSDVGERSEWDHIKWHDVLGWDGSRARRSERDEGGGRTVRL
jgi:hypothetical protein